MNKVLLYNPAISTLNKGDEIICDSAKKQIKGLTEQAFVVEVSTHLPVSIKYAKLLQNANFDNAFVLGTNLLMGDLSGRFRQWDINYFTAKLLPQPVLLGAGWWQYNDAPNWYTKGVYHSILRGGGYLHSVRDDYTADQLSKIGISNVIVTGCPTMWDFTPEFLENVPDKKASAVCTTITDYRRDEVSDAKMLNILLKSYEKVFLWLQGVHDRDYIHLLKKNIPDFNRIVFVASDLSSFDDVLSQNDVDYVGTRLHAGIRALQHKRRTIIIAVDNRAMEKKHSFNLPVLERSQISELGDLINSKFESRITLPFDNIAKWKKQFEQVL